MLLLNKSVKWLRLRDQNCTDVHLNHPAQFKSSILMVRVVSLHFYSLISINGIFTKIMLWTSDLFVMQFYTDNSKHPVIDTYKLQIIFNQFYCSFHGLRIMLWIFFFFLKKHYEHFINVLCSFATTICKDGSQRPDYIVIILSVQRVIAR